MLIALISLGSTTSCQSTYEIRDGEAISGDGASIGTAGASEPTRLYYTQGPCECEAMCDEHDICAAFVDNRLAASPYGSTVERV